MRVLMLGTVNSPHLVDLAEAVAGAGEEVFVAGWASPDVDLPAPRPPVRTILAPRRALSRLGAVFMPIWMARLVRRLRPDVVQVQGATEIAVAAVRAGARPLLVTVLGSEVLVENPGLHETAAYSLRRTNAFTADSPFLLSCCAALGATRERGHVIGWGVDLGHFTPGDREGARRALGLPAGRLLLSPRALRPLYRVATIVEAFDRLADEDAEVRLLIKHLGGYEGIPRSRHPDRVHVLGQVPLERLPDVYRAADVCISIPRSDSAPRTVWEAMACGCPCVLSDLPWLEGMVKPGREALVTAIGPAELAAAVRRLLDDRPLAHALATQARGLVQREHDAHEQYGRWLALFRELAAGAA